MIGSGTGYSAAVLAAIGVEVTALESDSSLPVRRGTPASTRSKARSKRGVEQGAPYDLILIDGAVEPFPDALIAQLADGGRLGGALIDRGVTRLVIGRKAGDAFGTRSIGDAGVPPLARLRAPAGLQILGD